MIFIEPSTSVLSDRFILLKNGSSTTTNKMHVIHKIDYILPGLYCSGTITLWLQTVGLLLIGWKVSFKTFVWEIVHADA